METSTVSSLTSESMNNSSETSAFFYVYIMLSLVGMVGNLFVCLVMLRNRRVFSSTTNKLILHQSLVDFLGSLVFFLRRSLIFTPSTVPDNILGTLYCRLWWSEWPQYGMFLTSTYNLVAISMERYLVTCRPIKHCKLFSTRRLQMIMIAPWLCGWIPEAHLVLIAHLINGECDAIWPSPAIQAVGGVLVFLKDLLIPVSVIIFSYTQIILELNRRSAARIRDNNQDAGNMLSKANKKITKTLILVAVFFVICWTPTDINYILYNLGLNDNFVNSLVFQTMSIIVTVNICINPFIYCFTYDRFQRQAKKMMLGICQQGTNRVDTMDRSTRNSTTALRNATISATV